MNEQQNAFLQKIVVPAQSAQKKWNVPASISIAQAILESSNKSGWGQSSLALEANNYFGIKALHVDQPNTYVAHLTHEYLNNHLDLVEAKFQRYASIADSFEAHARLLATARRYRPAMADCQNPGAFALQLEACGYSTSPEYAEMLQRLIRIYDLTQYDVPHDTPAKAQEAAA
jgi:flagellum-specific peptidoglycan hydrolase FlgJ